jgi:cyanate lyase
MPKSEAAELVVAARIRRKLSWADVAAEIDAPLVWTVAALLGQHPMTAAQADKVCALLELDGPVSESCSVNPAGASTRRHSRTRRSTGSRRRSPCTVRRSRS